MSGRASAGGAGEELPELAHEEEAANTLRVGSSPEESILLPQTKSRAGLVAAGLGAVQNRVAVYVG